MSSFISKHMASPQLPNYLLSHRKRLALSQDEVAFLLGAESGAKVCRYERFAREPGLQTALAYQAVFRRPVSELFGGLYREIEKKVASRAMTLLERVDQGKRKAQTVRKQEVLAAMGGLKTSKSNNHQ